MDFTGERFIPNIEGWLAFQHYHRYYFSSKFLDLSDKIVLDIACGEGFGSHILAKNSQFVYGIDISKESVEHATASYKSSNLKFLEGSTSSIPLNDSSVDIVVSYETIEHHNEHEKMLLEIKRILKPNGILIISSPDKGFYEKHFPGYKNVYHVKELYSKEFEKLIAKNFKFVDIFLQNNVFGSIITPTKNPISPSIPLQFQISDGTANEVEPRFNICIASDIKLSIPSVTTFCSPSSSYDIYALIDEKNRNIERIKKSYRWKIGGLFTAPYRFFKKYL